MWTSYSAFGFAEIRKVLRPQLSPCRGSDSPRLADPFWAQKH